MNDAEAHERHLSVCHRTGRFVTIETRHWPPDRTLTHLTFTSPVSFPVDNNDQQAAACLRRCTCDFFSFSDGVHYLHSAGWDGPRHPEEVSACSAPAVLTHRVCFRESAVCAACVQVQSRGPWVVCQHRPGVDHHRGVGDALVFVPADGSQRPLHLWPPRLQWIQICWVNVRFFQTEVLS